MRTGSADVLDETRSNERKSSECDLHYIIDGLIGPDPVLANVCLDLLEATHALFPESVLCYRRTLVAFQNICSDRMAARLFRMVGRLA